MHSYDGAGESWCQLSYKDWSTLSLPQICLANTPDSPICETDDFVVWGENIEPFSVPWDAVSLPVFTDSLLPILGLGGYPNLLILHIRHLRMQSEVGARTLWAPGYDCDDEALNLTELRRQWKLNKNRYHNQMHIQEQIVRQIRYKINCCSCKWCKHNRTSDTKLR